jgi:hypothetical protein
MDRREHGNHFLYLPLGDNGEDIPVEMDNAPLPQRIGIEESQWRRRSTDVITSTGFIRLLPFGYSNNSKAITTTYFWLCMCPVYTGATTFAHFLKHV